MNNKKNQPLKLWLGLGGLLVVFCLALAYLFGNQSPEQVKNKAENKAIRLEIIEKNYQYKDEYSNGSRGVILTLKLENKSQQPLNLAIEDFEITQGRGQVMSNEFGIGLQYEDQEIVEAGGELTLEILVHLYSTDKQYGLTYQPLKHTKLEPIEVDFDLEDYQAPNKELAEVTQAYLDYVFLGQNLENAQLDPDNAAFGREQYIDRFKRDLDTEFLYFVPDEAQQMAIIDKTIAANHKHSKIKVDLVSLVGDEAKVKVTAETITGLDEHIQDYVPIKMEEMADSDKSDFTKATEAEEAYFEYMQAQIPKSKLSKKEEVYEGENDFIILLKRNAEGKWAVENEIIVGEDETKASEDYKALNNRFSLKSTRL